MLEAAPADVFGDETLPPSLPFGSPMWPALSICCPLSVAEPGPLSIAFGGLFCTMLCV